MTKRGCARLFGLSAWALLSGCADESAADAEGSEEGSEVVAACKELCDVQAAGDGCPSEPSANCIGLCELYAKKTGECAARTQQSLECKQGMTWRCSQGSSQAISTDGLCGAEQDAVSEACED